MGHKSLSNAPDPGGRETVHDRTDTSNDSKISQSSMSTSLEVATTTSTRPFPLEWQVRSSRTTRSGFAPRTTVLPTCTSTSDTLNPAVASAPPTRLTLHPRRGFTLCKTSCLSSSSVHSTEICVLSSSRANLFEPIAFCSIGDDRPDFFNPRVGTADDAGAPPDVPACCSCSCSACCCPCCSSLSCEETAASHPVSGDVSPPPPCFGDALECAWARGEVSLVSALPAVVAAVPNIVGGGVVGANTAVGEDASRMSSETMLPDPIDEVLHVDALLSSPGIGPAKPFGCAGLVGAEAEVVGGLLGKALVPALAGTLLP